MFNFSPFLRFISKTTYFINNTVIARDCRMLYVVSGNGLFECDGEIYKLSQSSLIYYPYGKAYRIKSENELLFYTLNFDFTEEFSQIKTMIPTTPDKFNSNEIFATIPTPEFSKILYFENAIWAEEGIKNMYEESLGQQNGYREIQNSELKILLTRMWRHSNSVNSTSLCQSVKAEVSSNLSINIQGIAKHLNYHPYYLNDLFKKSENISLHKYIEHQRLIRASKLLSETKLTIEEIALSCGFSSHAHLSSSFKKVYGISPKELRKTT